MGFRQCATIGPTWAGLRFVKRAMTRESLVNFEALHINFSMDSLANLHAISNTPYNENNRCGNMKALIVTCMVMNQY